MAPFSSMSASNLEPVHHGLVSLNCGNLEVGKQQQFGMDTAELGTWNSSHNDSASWVRTPQPHTTSQYRFLTWVAYTRKLHPGVTEKEQRICPMVGCELEFSSHEFMLLHVKTCLLLSKGHYWCFESKKQERIGKCDTEACVELKGGIVNAMSTSFRSVKRHLSGHRSKSPQISEDFTRNSVVDQERSHLYSPWDQSIGLSELPCPVKYLEMETSFNSSTQEECLSELHSTDSPLPWSSGKANQSWCPPSYPEFSHAATSYDQEQQCHHPGPTQPGTNFVCEQPDIAVYDGKPWQLSLLPNPGSTQTPCSERAIYEQHEPAELHASSVAALANDKTHRYIQNNSPSWSQFSANERTGKFGPATLDIDHSASSSPPSYAHQHYQAHQFQTHHTEDIEYDDKMGIDERLGKADSHVSSETQCRDFRRGPRMDSTTSSDSDVVRSMFSTVSTMSSANGSMTSCNSSTAGLDEYQYPSMHFFEDNPMVEEPDSIEPLASPLRLSNLSDIELTTTRRTDAQGVSIDNYFEPGSYLPKSPYIACHPLTQVGNINKSSEAIPLSTTPTPLHPSISPGSSSPPSTSNGSPVCPPRRSPCKVACRFKCGSIVDISNRSRHEKRCRSNPARSQGTRLQCVYPGCSSTFDRKDNLKQHQDTQNHPPVENVELHLRINTIPGSPTWELAMNAQGQQRRSRHARHGRRQA